MEKLSGKITSEFSNHNFKHIIMHINYIYSMPIIRNFNIGKQKVLILLLILWTMNVWGQEPNYILNKNESGITRQYKAYDFISLKPGFSYSALTGNSFNAKIQKGIPPLPASNTYAMPDGTITSNPADGGIVGSIPGRFNVNGGAATFSIPIECPAGINGKQPNISLEYNSQGGNGPLGVGWNIGGLSSITRTGMNLFSDNNFSGINVDDELFLLDGNRLIVTNSVIPAEYNMTVTANPNTTVAGHKDEWNTTPGSKFETENKTFSKIETFGSIPYIWFNTPANYTQWVSKSTGPRYFKVSTKAGDIIEYTAARNHDYITEDNGETVNMEWVITKITDANGNYMTISYDDSYEPQTVIKQIDYTRNSTNNSLPFMSVIFNYVEKIQVESFYISNASFNDHFLLKNIQIKPINAPVIKQYDLNYAESERDKKYYLENISLTGIGNEKFNPTVFEWGVNNEVINIGLTNTPEPYSQQPVSKSDRYWQTINANGDGIDDVVNFYPAKIADQNGVYQTKNYVQIFNTSISNGQFSFSNAESHEIGDAFSYNDIKSPNPSVLTGDINGDGKDELIIPQLSITNNNVMQFKIVGGNTLERVMNSSTLPAYNIADINNDGIDEIIYIEKVITGNEYSGAISYTLANNSKSWVSIQFSIPDVPQRIICSDFNSDGLVDLMILTDTRYYIYENEGSNKNIIVNPTAIFEKIESNNDWSKLNNGLSTIKKGDFNGDGAVDFIINGHCNSNWSLAINDGNFGFDYIPLNNITATEEDYTSNNNDKEDCIVTDFNRDGKSDIIIVDPVYNSSGVFTQTDVTWYASTGSSFAIAKTFTTYDESYTFNKFNFTGDFDGDGRQDVLSYGSDIYNGWGKTDYVFIQNAFNNNFDGNLIKSITNGMGIKTEINYQPLTYTTTPDNKTFYTKGTTSVYPVVDVQIPLYCVSKVSEPNGQGGMNTTEFAYAEARAQLTGRGFLGFKTQTTSNAASNRKVVSFSEIDLSLYLPLSVSTVVSTLSGTPVSSIQNSYTNYKTDKIIYSIPKQSVNSDNLNNLITKTDYLTFDSVGNVTKIKTSRSDEVFSTKTSSYVQSGSWCANKPEKIRLVNFAGNDSIVHINSYIYDTKGNLTSEIIDEGDVNQQIIEYKEWTNVYGIPTRTEVTANGITRHSTITLNSSGRYIDSKTDVLGQTTNYVWYPNTGLLNYESNRIGTTTYGYNGLGQLIATSYPDGYIQNVVQWASPDNAFGARFYVYQGSSGSAPVYTWFDGLQREIVKESYGLKGNKSRVFTQYRADGKVDKVSAPTFGSEPSAWDAVYAYYTDGRLNTVTTPLGTTTTYYSGNSTSVTTPEGSQTTTLNAAGQVAESSVNGKTVTYDYYPSGLAKTITPQNGQAISME
ncbi:MAG TPA: FG-GAP-like repeat-containing protein, partial [Paludibacter sp.]|nr:FG-GAP-like repeat-containing protein [Paludibacter sp.]